MNLVTVCGIIREVYICEKISHAHTKRDAGGERVHSTSRSTTKEYNACLETFQKMHTRSTQGERRGGKQVGTWRRRAEAGGSYTPHITTLYCRCSSPPRHLSLYRGNEKHSGDETVTQ